MRSVVIYLKDAEKTAVTEVLSTFAKSFPGPEWISPLTGDPTIWIRYYDEYLSELELEDLVDLVKALGQMPSIALIADISGRINGEKEAKFITDKLLSVFSGVANNGYSEHYWSLTEINSDATREVLRFFDSQGWYDKLTHQKE
ncbi:MAG TPA: hypothetical protein VGH19_13450 [Verrucomicrobiae bacterium]